MKCLACLEEVELDKHVDAPCGTIYPGIFCSKSCGHYYEIFEKTITPIPCAWCHKEVRKNIITDRPSGDPYTYNYCSESCAHAHDSYHDYRTG